MIVCPNPIIDLFRAVLYLLGWINGYNFFPDNASSIAIFGSKGSGKTTLWQQLQGKFKDADYHPTLGAEGVNQFSIEYKGNRKTISESKDFGGGDNLVKYYGEIIKEGTFVYYLIDLTALEENKRETRARLQALGNVFKQKQLKDKVGIRIVGTNWGKYSKQNPKKTHSDAKYELANIIGFKDIKDVKVEESIIVAELTDKNDINQFYEQIIK